MKKFMVVSYGTNLNYYSLGSGVDQMAHATGRSLDAAVCMCVRVSVCECVYVYVRAIRTCACMYGNGACRGKKLSVVSE